MTKKKYNNKFRQLTFSGKYLLLNKYMQRFNQTLSSPFQAHSTINVFEIRLVNVNVSRIAS